MRNIREVLRLRLCAKLKYRQISQSTKVSMGSIKKLLSRADELGLSWPLPDDLDDAGLARLFYPSSDTTVSSRYIKPDWSAVHHELKRKGMTKQLRGKNTPQLIPTAVNVPCAARRTKLVKNALSIIVGKPIIDAASGESLLCNEY